MKRTIYTIIYSYLIVFGSSLTAFSMPALRTPIEVTQPDGTKLTLLLKGDEFLHFAQTLDGYDLKQNTEGFYTYATRDTDGRLLSGEVIARNVEKRSTQDKAYLSTVSTGRTFSGTVINNALQRRMMHANRGGTSLRSTSQIPPGLLADYPRRGSCKALVILVNYADESFKPANTVTSFSNMLNLPGYHENNHAGSVRDYYIYNSGGLFSPEFEVVGPVTLPNDAKYYGENDTNGNDMRPAKMVYDACKLVDDMVDFSQLDYDADGYVDGIYVYYAGKGEADGGGENTIWPHSWSLVSSKNPLTLDDKKIDAYACSAELDGRSGVMTGMGTLTHEYSHVLGLTDMYDVDYEKYNGEAFDLNYWSLMAYGAYNNNSCTPPCLTFPERYFLGWATPIVLDTTQAVTVTDLGSTNNGYKINTNNSGEYFLLENRQLNLNPWDTYLPFHGMLIYHIDMRTDQQLSVDYWGTPLNLTIDEMWRMNMVNALAVHQCCDIEEADKLALLYSGKNFNDYYNSILGDPFPGLTGVYQFSDYTNPSMKSWDGSEQVKPISAITESNGEIRFKFMDYSGLSKSPNILTAKTVGPYTFTAIWNLVMNATGYYVDVFTMDQSTNPPTKVYLDGLQNKYVVDTFLNVSVSNDLSTYYYQVRGTMNNTLYTPMSDSTSLTTTDGTPSVLPASLVDKYEFRANWARASYATGYYLDVFTVDINTGDTTWLPGYKNFYLTRNYQLISELDDQTTYKYRIRATNGKITSRNSPVTSLLTIRASEIMAYSKERTIYLKGNDKGSQVLVHFPDGRLLFSTNTSHITVKEPGIYLITAYYDGKPERVKLLVP